MNYYIDNLSPFALQLAPEFGIRWYGLAYITGLLVGWGILIDLCRQKFLPLSAKTRMQFIFSLLFGVVLGGRIGFMLLYFLPQFIGNPLTFFDFSHGGMSSHGGFIGVAVACALFARSQKIPFFKLSDALCIMTPPGLFLGRLANFINGELWGRISHLPWAVIFPKSAPDGTPLSLIAPRHPSQLYEAALEGLFLFAYTQIRYRQTKLRPPGQLTAEFLFFYALVRIICECFREPDATLFFGVSRGIFYSILMLPIAVGLWVWQRKQNN